MRKEFEPEQRTRLERLAILPEDQIDTVDIPEAPIENWRRARRPGAGSASPIRSCYLKIGSQMDPKNLTEILSAQQNNMHVQNPVYHNHYPILAVTRGGGNPESRIQCVLRSPNHVELFALNFDGLRGFGAEFYMNQLHNDNGGWRVLPIARNHLIARQAEVEGAAGHFEVTQVMDHKEVKNSKHVRITPQIGGLTEEQQFSFLVRLLWACQQAMVDAARQQFEG